MNKIIRVLGLMLVVSHVNAEDLNENQIYFGGGFSLNDAGFSDNATGFQVFAGFPLPVKVENVNLSVEVGYMDSGDFDRRVSAFDSNSLKANGLWGTAVADIPLKGDISAIGRIGLDIGDDDGVMIGAGVSFTLNEQTALRLEYVVRDTIDSLQLNLVFRQ